jgi:hypothetical protein
VKKVVYTSPVTLATRIVFAMFLLAPALVCGSARSDEIAPKDGDIGNYVVIEQMSCDFFGDGRETPIELVFVDNGICPDYFWRVTPQGEREPKYYPLSLYTSLAGFEPELKVNDIDGDGIPEIFVRYHAGGTGGLEFSLYTFKGGKPRELVDTTRDRDNDTEYPDVYFKLMDGFRINAHYAGKETVYKVDTSSQTGGYFFMPDGTLNKESILEIDLTANFSDIDLVDIDGDGISEIRGSLIIGGAGTNASYFGDVGVVYVWKDGKLRVRDVVDIRFKQDE